MQYGTFTKGLARYHDTKWEWYSTDNSPLPSNTITALLVDLENGIWIGTNRGLLKLSNNSWRLFNTSNSKLPSNLISGLALDRRGRVWIATEGELAQFDGSSWIVFKKENSPLPTNFISSVAVSSAGDVWVGLFAYPFSGVPPAGLGHFDGSNWQFYIKDNSGLPDNWVTRLYIDKDGAIWIGTQFSGLVRFQKGKWRHFETKKDETIK